MADIESLNQTIRQSASALKNATTRTERAVITATLRQAAHERRTLRLQAWITRLEQMAADGRQRLAQLQAQPPVVITDDADRLKLPAALRESILKRGKGVTRG